MRRGALARPGPPLTGPAPSRVRPGPSLAALVASALLAAAPAFAFDTGLYARLLERHTTESDDVAGVRVAYARLRDDPDWARLVADLGSARTRVPTARDEALAFWINAYNIVAIETVVRGRPVESIRDLGSPIVPVWKRRDVAVAGAPRSLDEIEHDVLRPMGEPRIHAALVCASLSCPPLARTPWRADRLDAMFEDALARWLRNPHKGARVVPARRTIWLSRVFEWFADDFGGAERDVLLFVRPHLGERDRAWLEAHLDDVEVDYLHYDWRLNAWADAPAATPAP